MAKASKPKAVVVGVIKPSVKPLTHEEMMARTTPAQRHQWAHNYVASFARAQMAKRRMGGM